MKAGHRHRIEQATKQRLARVEYLPGGCVGEVWQAHFDEGPPVVAKCAVGADNLHIEAYMLRYLKDHSKLPVPQVLGAGPDLLILEMIGNDGSHGAEVDRDAADHLATLHEITVSKFGLDKDTLIGPLAQLNTWSDSWIDFYANQRLRPLAELALSQSKLPVEIYTRLIRLCDGLGQWLVEPKSPSLLHGDVWGGNVLTKSNRIAAFIDPAIYYGDREAELAYTTLFNSFGDQFLDRYQDHHKLDGDFFKTRLPIYHLYPLLVHVVLFGGSYVVELNDILKRYVG